MTIRSALAVTLGFIAFILASPAPAEEWSGRKVISQITVWTDKTVVVRKTDGAWPNPDLCTRDDAIVLLPPEAQGGSNAYKEVYAALLSAYLTGAEVNAFITGCATIGNSSFPLFTQLSTFKDQAGP